MDELALELLAPRFAEDLAERSVELTPRAGRSVELERHLVQLSQRLDVARGHGQRPLELRREVTVADDALLGVPGDLRGDEDQAREIMQRLPTESVVDAGGLADDTDKWVAFIGLIILFEAARRAGNQPAATPTPIEVIRPAATDQLGGTAEKLCTTNFSARPRSPAATTPTTPPTPARIAASSRNWARMS